MSYESNMKMQFHRNNAMVFFQSLIRAIQIRSQFSSSIISNKLESANEERGIIVLPIKESNFYSAELIRM